MAAVALLGGGKRREQEVTLVTVHPFRRVMYARMTDTRFRAGLGSPAITESLTSPCWYIIVSFGSTGESGFHV